MTRFRLIQLLVCAVLLFTFCGLAHAQQRTFVSGLGNDANPCTRTAPCRSFQSGHDAVAAGGEVVALDSSGYGSITITKSVTLSGEGVHASLTAQGNNAVAVTINTAGVVVRLRYLTILGFNTSGGSDGIRYLNGAALHIEHCTISGFSDGGLEMGTTGRLYVSDSTIRNNRLGVFITIGAGTGEGPFGQTTIERTRIEQNTNHGIDAVGGKTTIRQSRLAGHGNFGLSAANSGVEVTVDDCIFSHNTIGISSRFDAIVRVANSTIADNGTGLHASGGQLLSRVPASNTLEGNGVNGAFTGTYNAQ